MNLDGKEKNVNLANRVELVSRALGGTAEIYEEFLSRATCPDLAVIAIVIAMSDPEKRYVDDEGFLYVKRYVDLIVKMYPGRCEQAVATRISSLAVGVMSSSRSLNLHTNVKAVTRLTPRKELSPLLKECRESPSEVLKVIHATLAESIASHPLELHKPPRLR